MIKSIDAEELRHMSVKIKNKARTPAIIIPNIALVSRSWPMLYDEKEHEGWKHKITLII